MRQVVLDTETTGLETREGHRIIEIGCVELVNRRLTGKTYHQYIKPDREIDQGALEVHGISNEFLADKPRFADVVEDFLRFVKGAELVIHNAPFDTGFLNHEFGLLTPSRGTIEQYCTVRDTLAMAREKHPGQKNNLDALCKRYDINNTQRTLHGALLDSEILADVYLAMTGGQTALSWSENKDGSNVSAIRRLAANRPALKVMQASPQEEEDHREYLQEIDKASGGQCLWLQMEGQQTQEH